MSQEPKNSAPSTDYKATHERSSPLVLNEKFGEKAVGPLVRISSSSDQFNIERGTFGLNRNSWDYSISVHNPEAARELAAHLLEWANHKEEQANEK